MGFIETYREKLLGGLYVKHIYTYPSSVYIMPDGFAIFYKPYINQYSEMEIRAADRTDIETAYRKLGETFLHEGAKAAKHKAHEIHVTKLPSAVLRFLSALARAEG